MIRIIEIILWILLLFPFFSTQSQADSSVCSILLRKYPAIEDKWKEKQYRAIRTVISRHVESLEDASIRYYALEVGRGMINDRDKLNQYMNKKATVLWGIENGERQLNDNDLERSDYIYNIYSYYILDEYRLRFR